MSSIILAGVDEAGRGALAGPVVAGAVVFPPGVTGKEFRDSKALTEKMRESLFQIITTQCDWGVGMVTAKEIDEIGIKPATNQAMQMAVDQLKAAPTKLLVDGRDGFAFAKPDKSLLPSKDIVHGDDLEPLISAASIVAKVSRDRWMKELAHKYPKFSFEKNKGYGAKPHLQLLEKEIYCPEHRKSYEPLRTWLTQGRLF